MKKLSEFVKESIEINEKVFDLTYQITHDTLFSVGNGRLCMHMTLDGGDNSLYETIPDAGALFIPYKYNDKGNWAIVKISPRDKRNDRPVKNLVKKIKAKKIESVSFSSGGWPHAGPVVTERPKSEYTINFMEFDPEKLRSLLGNLESEFYVYSKSNALTGIAGIDSKYFWEPFRRLTGK